MLLVLTDTSAYYVLLIVVLCRCVVLLVHNNFVINIYSIIVIDYKLTAIKTLTEQKLFRFQKPCCNSLSLKHATINQGRIFLGN